MNQPPAMQVLPSSPSHSSLNVISNNNLSEPIPSPSKRTLAYFVGKYIFAVAFGFYDTYTDFAVAQAYLGTYATREFTFANNSCLSWWDTSDYTACSVVNVLLYFATISGFILSLSQLILPLYFYFKHKEILTSFAEKQNSCSPFCVFVSLLASASTAHKDPSVTKFFTENRELQFVAKIADARTLEFSENDSSSGKKNWTNDSYKGKSWVAQMRLCGLIAEDVVSLTVLSVFIIPYTGWTSIMLQSFFTSFISVAVSCGQYSFYRMKTKCKAGLCCACWCVLMLILFLVFAVGIFARMETIGTDFDFCEDMPLVSSNTDKQIVDGSSSSDANPKKYLSGCYAVGTTGASFDSREGTFEIFDFEMSKDYEYSFGLRGKANDSVLNEQVSGKCKEFDCPGGCNFLYDPPSCTLFDNRDDVEESKDKAAVAIQLCIPGVLLCD